MFDQQDYQFMARALKLAKKCFYTTHPNPRVGCVIVRGGEILAEGWTQKAGSAHAEAHAISRSTASLTGATVYVTLEPCSHYGKTPPCSEALIKCAVSRVVVATTDPNPSVNGGGLDALEQAGIEVETGLMQSQAREINKGFFSLHERSRPWVRLKSAASLDGKTAMASGESQWITSEQARTDGHKFRARSAAILTGVNTVLDDDPSLTVRLEGVERQPLRVILDSKLQMPPQAKIFTGGGDVLILTCLDNDNKKATQLKKKGANVLQVETHKGRLNLHKVMETLAAMGINEIHVEAGKTLSGQLIAENLADELVIYLAPTILGDNARGMFHIPGLESLQQQKNLIWQDQRMVGNDLRLIMRFKS